MFFINCTVLFILFVIFRIFFLPSACAGLPRSEAGSEPRARSSGGRRQTSVLPCRAERAGGAAICIQVTAPGQTGRYDLSFCLVNWSVGRQTYPFQMHLLQNGSINESIHEMNSHKQTVNLQIVCTLVFSSAF